MLNGRRIAPMCRVPGRQKLAKSLANSTMPDSGQDPACNGPGVSGQAFGGVDLQKVEGPGLQLRRLGGHRKAMAGTVASFSVRVPKSASGVVRLWTGSPPGVS